MVKSVRKVKFNKDKSVEVTEGLNTDKPTTETRTAQQYKDYNEGLKEESRGKTGTGLASGDALVQARQNAREEATAKSNTIMSERQKEIESKQLMKPQLTQEAEQEAQKIFSTQTDTGNNIDAVSAQTLGGIVDTNKAQAVANATGSVKGAVKALMPFGAGARLLLNTVFDAADNLRAITSLGGKDTLDVKTSKENMTLASDEIQKQIELVKNGQQNALELVKAINQYEQELNYLDATTKRTGIDNIAYWATDGRNLEEEIINYQSDLQTLKKYLAEAILEQKMNTQRQQLLTG